METRKLIRKLLIFGALFVPLSLGFNLLYQSQLRKGRLEIMDEVAHARADHIRFLFLGDSHARHAIDTSKVPGSFVYAGRGESYMLNFYRLRSYIQRNGPPPTVLLEFDPHSLSGYRNDKVLDAEYWVNQMRLDTIAASGGSLLSWTSSLRARFFSYVGNWRRVLYAVHPRLPDYIDVEGIGWLPVERAVNLEEGETLDADAELAAGFHFDAHRAASPEMMHWLEEIGRLCARHAVALILVSYPLSDPYLEAWDARVAAEKWMAVEKRMKQKISHARHLDFRNVFRNAPGLFYDSHHLNEAGNQKFSEMLCDSLAQCR